MNNGKVCISICAETPDEMITKIKRAEELADLIEIRFDCVSADQLELTFELMESYQVSKPLIATFRSAEQGAKTSATFDQRKEFWQKTHTRFYAADVEEDVFQFAGHWNKRIASFHDFDGVTAKLEAVFENLCSTDADVIKIAVQSNDISDAIPVWKLFKQTNVDGRNVIPIAMGEVGKWTRILGLAHGTFLTYASIGEGDETASGQITAKDLIETYRVKELDLETKVYGVIGDPVSESLSPYMHNAAFADQNINAVFIPLQVKDLDEFILRMVRPKTREVELNFAGFAVTMPHKQAIIKHLDAIDPTAEKIGAVNTVKIDDGKLIGYNTDAYGFITPLKERFGDVSRARVAVFGAGGAARACVYALKQEGANVNLLARDKEKTQVFADEFDLVTSQISNLKSQIPKILFDNFDIIVNATPVGMKGPLENESLFSAEQLEGVKFVYDLVTSAVKTPIIHEAKKANIPYLDGFDMLIHQGAKQFEIWTGQSAPIVKMKEAIQKKID
ncbi:MAG: shikimate dehydrogenase [Chloracidobacterium sp.]|nr:shikimate dehydrogenase [Chloracidobacterium sp.]